VVERDNVRAVFFDAGYTLLCMDPSQETIFSGVCRDLGIPIDSSSLPDAIRTANSAFAPKTPASTALPFSQDRVDRFWTDYHGGVLAVCAIDPADARRAGEVYRSFTAAIRWRVYDDVLPSLAKLRARGIALGVVSNWTGDLEAVLHQIELRRQFDIVLDSSRLGHEKPHREIFREALRRAAVAPNVAVHVGDSIDHDVEGALAAGMRAVLLDRENRHAGFTRAPRVRHLGEFVEIVLGSSPLVRGH
jgi:putative hydrolase of the HAD superfamily